MPVYIAAYRWTQEELLRAMRHHYQTQMRPSIVMAVNIFSVLLAALSVLMLINGGLQTSAALSACLFIGFVVYWLFLRKPVSQWWVGRGFNKRPDANKLIRWEISAELIKTHCEGLAVTESQWKLFIKVVETSEGFLFYAHRNFFYWLPYSAFELPEGVEQVRHLIRTNGIEHAIR